MRGIEFMSNDKSLISFSLISTTWEKYKKDNIDMIIPFVLYYFKECEDVKVNNIVSISDAKQYIQAEFGMKILSNVLEHIFRRLCNPSHNLLRKGHKEFYLVSKDIDISDFKHSRETNKITQKIVIDSFFKFLDNKQTIYDTEVASNALINYLCNYGKDVISEHIVLERGDIWNYRVGEFIEFVSKTDINTFEYIKNIAKGGMISSIIFYNVHVKSKKKFRNTEVYYDTSLLMHILGYSGEALQESVTEMTAILQEQNAKICYFRHNLQEVEGILNAYIALYNQKKLYQSYNFEYFITQNINPETVSEYIVLLEKQLSKKGLTVKETPDYSDQHKNIDWTKFDSYLSDNISYINPKRRKNDVESLAAIYRLRQHDKYDNYETCQALFVSTNRSLVYHSNRYFKFDESKRGVPAIIDDTFLTTLIWLKNDNKNEQLPTLKIIADSLSSQTLPPSFWEAFLTKVENYEKENIITPDEAISFKIEVFTKKSAYDMTDGDIEKLDPSTMQEILRRNDLEKHKEIIKEKNELLKDNTLKDSAIDYLSHKFINSRIEFHLGRRISKWRIFLLLSKLWLLILCVILVGISKIFELILSHGYYLFLGVPISVFLSVMSKFMDKKLSSHNKGIEKYFHKKSFQSLSRLIKSSEVDYFDEIIDGIKHKIIEFTYL